MTERDVATPGMGASPEDSSSFSQSTSELGQTSRVPSVSPSYEAEQRAEQHPRSFVQWWQTVSERFLPAMGVWVFFLTFSGQGIRNVTGWVPFGMIALLSLVLMWLMFWGAQRRVTMRRLSLSVSAFVAVCCLSTIWSQYRLETFASALISVATTSAGIFLAISFPLRHMLQLLTTSLKWMIAVSYVLEIFVALFLGHRLAPLYMANWKEVPELYYWVNGLLFQGGPIQGFVGNRNPLAFIALLLLLCVLVQWIESRSNHMSHAFWMGMALLTLGLTRSATVSVAALASCVVVLFFLFLRHFSLRERRFYARAALTAAGSFVLVAVLLHEQLTQVLGRSSDLTGRGVIWEKLLQLWTVHPFEGWGWLVIWPPWIPLFRGLVVRPDGTPTMQAHNSYIEALFQTGLIGLTLLAFAVLWVALRIFRVALRSVDRDLMPMLAAALMTAMFVQSFTESRLLTEGNWVLFVAFATWLKVRTESYVVNPPETGDSSHDSRESQDLSTNGLDVSA